jgi:Xaa-Pro aminopeptidase
VARYNRLAAGLAASHSREAAGSALPHALLLTTDRIVEQARAVKDAAEVAILREAARRLAGVGAAVPDLVRAGRTEMDVAGDIERLLRQAGFERPAFETIVASGPNGARPHARPTLRRLEANEGVVLDFGGVYDGYSVDLTRTVELGTPSSEWRRLRSAVAEAQEAAIAAVAPGVPSHRVDAAARAVLERHGLGEAFGHATGHGLGLDVHEEPRIARHTAGQPEVLLVPGMVFTVEPGAYVDGVGGVRIEDDVLVTGTGCEVLTRLRPPGSGRTSLGG